jgi:C4-dicarboxylate-specific signal transduction histidine kinase
MTIAFKGSTALLRLCSPSRILLLAWIGTAAFIGLLIHSEISELTKTEEGPSWSVFELGLEFQRLLLAAEKGESQEDISFRGDIYLSRVIILRDAPLLAKVRARMHLGDLSELFRSAQRIERHLAELDRPEAREALLVQLRADAGMVRQLTLSMAQLDRQIYAEYRKETGRQMLSYLSALGILMLILLVTRMLLDKTKHKLRHTGRELDRQLARQFAILRLVDTAIIGFSQEGKVLYSNPAAQALLGPAASTGTGPLRRGGGGEGIAADIASLLRELPAGAAGNLSRKVRFASAAGTRHYMISATSNGSLPGTEADAPDDTSIIVAVTDVTVQEDAALRREEYDAKLGEASRLLALAAMSGGIVHEISQPLAAIRNYAYALKVSLGLRQTSPEHLGIAERLGEEADRAIEVVRNVRRMGPQETEEGGMCDIHEAIAHSVRLVSLGAEQAPRIAVIPRGGNALVAGSLPMIGQVVVNLLKNALSASAAAGRAGAEVSVTFDGESAEVAVADFGNGVSENAANSMFAPFSKSERGGMGLGLAICQRIAANLGGSLSWQNGVHHGAIFRFRIPLIRQGEAA